MAARMNSVNRFYYNNSIINDLQYEKSVPMCARKVFLEEKAAKPSLFLLKRLFIETSCLLLKVSFVTRVVLASLQATQQEFMNASNGFLIGFGIDVCIALSEYSPWIWSVGYFENESIARSAALGVISGVFLSDLFDVYSVFYTKYHEYRQLLHEKLASKLQIVKEGLYPDQWVKRANLVSELTQAIFEKIQLQNSYACPVSLSTMIMPVRTPGKYSITYEYRSFLDWFENAPQNQRNDQNKVLCPLSRSQYLSREDLVLDIKRMEEVSNFVNDLLLKIYAQLSISCCEIDIDIQKDLKTFAFSWVSLEKPFLKRSLCLSEPLTQDERLVLKKAFKIIGRALDKRNNNVRTYLLWEIKNLVSAGSNIELDQLRFWVNSQAVNRWYETSKKVIEKLTEEDHLSAAHLF